MPESPQEAIALRWEYAPGDRSGPEVAGDARVIRVMARALGGMLKEALVVRPGEPGAWRLRCDEGPYLEGDDSAPPPLAYFAAGMASHNARLIMERARETHVDLGEWMLDQETRYTMQGSALKGTMKGGALPAEFTVRSSVAGTSELQEVVGAAMRQSVAESLMAKPFNGVFSVHHNARRVPAGRVPDVGKTEEVPDPAALWALMEAAAPATNPDRICKLRAFEASDDPDHGQGASLRESQKRVLHLHTALRVREDGLLQADVRLLRPVGSTFRFLARGPDVPSDRAPSGLDYLAAGIALCFMTQMGRYATITRRHLSSYEVVQDMVLDTAKAAIRRLATHAWVRSDESGDTARMFVDMSEQTCFLHASCRSGNPSGLRFANESNSKVE